MEILSEFSRRHLGPRPTDLAKMLAEVGATSIEELIEQTIPASIRLSEALVLPQPLSEPEALVELERLANRIG